MPVLRVHELLSSLNCYLRKYHTKSGIKGY